MPIQVRSIVADHLGSGDFQLGWEDGGRLLRFQGDEVFVMYRQADGSHGNLLLDKEMMPENIQRVGLGLILKFDGGQLELAGIILLMAMFGAVVLARKQIEITEDEKRQAAGMPRLGHEDEPAPIRE